MNKDITRGTIEMSAAMLISGTIGWFVVISGQPVFNVVFWRCLFAVFALLAVCGLLGLLKPITWKVLGLAVLGGVAIVLNWVCLFAAYADTSISLATIIYNTQPFMLLVLGGLFLGERITATKLGWLAISFAGMLLIVLTPDGQSASTNFLLGVGLSLTAAFLYAIATLVTKRLKGTPPHLIALIQVATGMVMLAPLADFSILPATGQPMAEPCDNRRRAHGADVLPALWCHSKIADTHYWRTLLYLSRGGRARGHNGLWPCAAPCPIPGRSPDSSCRRRFHAWLVLLQSKPRHRNRLTERATNWHIEVLGAQKPYGEEPNREHGEDDPKGAKTVTAPATVSGEVLCELCHWETGKAHIKPATREVRRPAVQEPG